MKLAGLTWWRNNYGSILQAYALQKILDRYENIEYEIINQYGKKIASFDNLLDKLKTFGLCKTLKRLVWRFGLKKLRARVYNVQHFIDKYLHISEQTYSENTIASANSLYDGFICGSDQIWNLTLSPLDSMYWLGFVERSKLKVSYGPSIGVTKVDASIQEKIRNNLSDFKAISCREKSGVTLINKILKSDNCVNVVDPTLLLTASEWDKIASKPLYNQKYIFVYLLRGTKQQRKYIENFAKKVGLSIITIPFLDNEKIEMYDFKFGNVKCWDASPSDFISLIKYAEYVFADSFHCMVFSTIYHTPFYVFPKILNDNTISQAQISRMNDLQEILGIGNRIITTQISYEEIVKRTEINWSDVEQQLIANREASLSFLENALNI